MIDIQLANVSRETCDQVDQLMHLHNVALVEYANRLLWWNKKVNLISRSMSLEDLLLHIRHSLYAFDLIRNSSLTTWIDTGTGGGLPGIPLSIVMPDKHFVLNDIVEKKGMVLRDIVYHLSLSNSRVLISDLAVLQQEDSFGVLSKHAFKLDDILSRLNGKPWKELLLLKGADYIDEVASVTHRTDTAMAYSLESAEPTSFFSGKYLLHLCQTE